MDSKRLAPALRQILSGLLTSAPLVLAVGCAASVVPTDGGGDVTVPPGDANQDVIRTTDAGDCAPVRLMSNSCQTPVLFPCGLPADYRNDAGTLDYARCQDICRPFTMDLAFGCNLTSTPQGDSVNCITCGLGRRTAGLSLNDAICEGDVLVRYLSRAAALEAASVTAFVRLREELEWHGAPESLLGQIDRAALQEADHAVRTHLATVRHGGTVIPAQVASVPLRSMFEIALENVREGCVRETFGALLMGWQASRAADPHLAGMFAVLNADETEHAVLSWALDSWLRPRLSDEENVLLDAALRTEVCALEAELGHEAPAMLRERAGVPRVSEAMELLAQTRHMVWNNAEVMV